MKLRNIGAGIAAAGLLIGFGASGAVANPVPDSGPTTGGTTVTLPAPEFRFTQVNAGGDVSAASGNNGQVYTWGSGGGALGDGTTNSSNVPVPVAAPAGVSLSLASSGAYGFANGSDLKTYAWAYDDTDDGDFNNFSLTPVPVHTGAAPAGTRFVQVSQADGGHAAAIGSDGDTYAWGEGGVGQLGDGLATTSFFPVRVQTPAGVHFTQVSVGHHFVIALGDDGKAYSWGSNDYGQLGDGTMTSRLVPVQVAQGAVPAGVRFVHVAAGDGFAAAVGDDGNVYTWGMNGNGQLGDGTMAGKTTPVKVLQGAIPAGVKILKVDATVSFAVALGDDGHAYAWGGENYHYFLGTDAFYQSLTPAQVQAGEVPAGVGFTDISVAFFSEERHTLAVGTNGKVYAWGSGGAGQLGNGLNNNQAFPVEVQGPEVAITGVTFDGLAGTSISAIDANNKFTVVTPERHPAGKVDVVVSWTLGGVAQTPITYSLGYEYLASISITDPADQTITEGSNATFTATPTSNPTPATVTWQVSTDNGATWAPITTDARASLSDGNTKLTITNAPLSHSGRLYRATATSLDGQATSNPAKLTVTSSGVAPPAFTDQVPESQPVPPKKIAKKLPDTGGFSIWYLAAGATLLAAGSGLILNSRLRRQEIN